MPSRSDEEREAYLLHATHYKDVAGTADQVYVQGGESITRGLTLFDQEWLNIQAGQA
jgi:hypothetical protein